MAIGRISGPMLFSNLDRQGVDLAFESNLLYLDVNNRRIGVGTSSPQYSLDSSGNVKLANLIILGNTITSNTGKINFGSVSNIVISGGSQNLVLISTGADGGVQWANISSLLQAITSVNATSGSFTTLTANNFSSGNAVISGGYITSLSNATITSANVNSLISSNATITGGNISGLANLSSTIGNISTLVSSQLTATSGNINTLVASNFSSTNAQITGGNVTANLFGNISGTFGGFSGNVTAPWFIGNVDGRIGNFITSISVANSYITNTNSQLQLINISGETIRSTGNNLVISANTSNPNNIIWADSVSAFKIPTGTTAQRPPNPVYGYFRFNTNLATVEWWSGTQWISGASPIANQLITPDGILSTFTLDQTATDNSVLVNINGTVQQPGVAYTVVGNQITFSEIPQVTDIIDIRFISAGTSFTGGGGGGNNYTSSSTAPLNPVVGDFWYKTSTDTLFQYTYDGTSEYWLDIQTANYDNYGYTLYSRSTFTANTGVLIPSESQNLNVNAFKSYILMSISTDHAAWVRIYSDATSRTADESRLITEDPVNGSGVLAEIATSGNTIQKITPFTVGGNLDEPPTTMMYLRVTNMTGANTAINIGITITRLEI